MKYTKLDQIESRTTPGKFYDINVNEKGELSCNCLSWINQRTKRPDRLCKHIDIYLAKVPNGQVPKNKIPRAERKRIHRFNTDMSVLNEVCGFLEGR